MIEGMRLVDGRVERSGELADLQSWRQGAASIWIDLTAPDDGELDAVLGGIFGLHPLTIEDCRHRSKYCKVDVLGEAAFTVLLSPRTTVPARAEFYMRELDLFLLPGVLITVHRESLTALEEARNALEQAPEAVLGAGPDRLYHKVVDTIVDRYIAAANAIEERAEALSSSAAFGGPVLLGEILDLRGSCRALGRISESIRGALGRLRRDGAALISDGQQLYFSDLDDHLFRVREILERSEDELSGARAVLVHAEARRRLRWLQVLSLLLFLLLLAAIASRAL